MDIPWTTAKVVDNYHEFLAGVGLEQQMVAAAAPATGDGGGGRYRID